MSDLKYKYIASKCKHCVWLTIPDDGHAYCPFLVCVKYTMRTRSQSGQSGQSDQSDQRPLFEWDGSGD